MALCLYQSYKNAFQVPTPETVQVKDIHQDALRPDWSYPTHFGLPRMQSFVPPSNAMKYDAFDGHDVVNKDLRKLMETEGLDGHLPIRKAYRYKVDEHSAGHCSLCLTDAPEGRHGRQTN
ncbi:hypothetical protein SAY87_031989 [Trapa incisa]|uniref:Uncharacterized protein n=1 Tax=Trapa incisa TaxID=236973 RepID=A0AAN7KYR5_9MYRT|nr:hypothetical protein SAY87_031989 [Trapa incisa]